MRKKTIIIVMLVMICIMAVGYAAFSTSLTINGTANIASTWKVVFTKIEEVSKTSGVTVTTAPTASGTSATFNVDLTSPGDKIEYKITVENQGTLDAIISNIDASDTGSDAIKFEVSNIQIGDKLAAKASTTFNVTISYNENITSQPNITVNTLTIAINYVQDVGQAIDPDNPIIVSTTLAGRILQDNIAYPDNVASPYVSSSAGINFSSPSSDTNGKGLYYTSTNTEDGKTTYYFRGAVENNYVSYAYYKWRIVRINEDGSVRLIIVEKPTGMYYYNYYDDNVKYVGYMYDNNTVNSSAKAIIDKWYVDYHIGSQYLSDAGFCNDRSVSSTYFSTLNFDAVRRINAGTPQFKCLDEENDLFTTSSSSKGNKALTYPVGLLTADEAMYAGAGATSINSSYYLDWSEVTSGGTYGFVTMTPANSSSPMMYAVHTNGYLEKRVVKGSNVDFRPVINIKGDLEVTGNGTSDSPYVIKTN